MSAGAAATHGHGWNVSTTMAQTKEWGTPPALYESLDREFGFTLDAAASPDMAKHVRYFTKDTDALAQSWAGQVVFCNPPYGRHLDKWMAKARLEADEHGATVVYLVPARTGTKWFHRIVLKYAAEVRFLEGRLNYTRGGAGRSNAPFDSMVVVFRPGLRRADDPAARAQLWLGLDMRGGRTV